MVYGLKIDKKYGKPVKGLLKRKKLYEDSYLPLIKADKIIFPLRTKNDDSIKEIEKYTREYSIKNFKFKLNKRTRSFRRELEKVLPQKIFNRASRAYEQIGDVAIITIFPEMLPYQEKIAESLLETNKGLRLVIKKTDKHSGKKRTQNYEILKGKGSTETTHLENGVKINLDINKVYFSARTANERKRVASLIKNNENVLVLFSGCAPYPLVISKNSLAQKIICIDNNPDAHEYARINIQKNNADNIKAILGDVEKEIKNLKKEFDRIIMPHPTEADYYFADALKVLRKNGIIHLYLFSKKEKINMVKNKVKNMARDNNFFVKKIVVNEQLHVSSEVKKYCFDIYLKSLVN